MTLNFRGCASGEMRYQQINDLNYKLAIFSRQYVLDYQIAPADRPSSIAPPSGRSPDSRSPAHFQSGFTLR
ncbi:hypothetical protein [Methanoculleus sp.]|jgi:hypothetical protein|uniref:hypothetical protein n=1 Tax=Methanoculleus sp. TaxID=90427 RepID=UPI002636B94A|nr:hypothetical protein [Methanoculleus sp.]MDI6867159.1 hypothetical protein [Methanoculleus sp.]